MSPDRLRLIALQLIDRGRPLRDDTTDIGEALLEWLQDPIGLPFEAFLGVTRQSGATFPTSLRDRMIREYAETLNKTRASTAATLMIDQVSNCDCGFSKPEDYGPLFVIFYKRLQALGFKLPGDRHLRRIIA